MDTSTLSTTGPLPREEELRCLLLGDIHSLLISLRDEIRWGSISVDERGDYLAHSSIHDDEVERERADAERARLLREFFRLRNLLQNASDVGRVSCVSIISPFLGIVRSAYTSGKLTAAALSGIGRLVRVGVIAQSSPAAEEAMAEIADAVVQCRFEATDMYNDSAVLLQVLQVLATCLSSPTGNLLSDMAAWEVILASVRISHPDSAFLAPHLRNAGYMEVLGMVRHLFSRLSGIMSFKPVSKGYGLPSMVKVFAFFCQEGQKAVQKKTRSGCRNAEFYLKLTHECLEAGGRAFVRCPSLIALVKDDYSYLLLLAGQRVVSVVSPMSASQKSSKDTYSSATDSHSRNLSSVSGANGGLSNVERETLSLFREALRGLKVLWVSSREMLKIQLQLLIQTLLVTNLKLACPVGALERTNDVTGGLPPSSVNAGSATVLSSSAHPPHIPSSSSNIDSSIFSTFTMLPQVRVLEMSRVTASAVELALEATGDLLAVSSAVVDLYVNFDCQMSRENILFSLIGCLTTIAAVVPIIEGDDDVEAGRASSENKSGQRRRSSGNFAGATGSGGSLWGNTQGRHMSAAGRTGSRGAVSQGSPGGKLRPRRRRRRSVTIAELQRDPFARSHKLGAASPRSRLTMLASSGVNGGESEDEEDRDQERDDVWFGLRLRSLALAAFTKAMAGMWRRSRLRWHYCADKRFADKASSEKGSGQGKSGQEPSCFIGKACSDEDETRSTAQRSGRESENVQADESRLDETETVDTHVCCCHSNGAHAAYSPRNLKRVREQKRKLRTGAQLFNDSAKKGLRYLQSEGILPCPLTAASVATFLHSLPPGLRKESVGAFIGAIGKEEKIPGNTKKPKASTVLDSSSGDARHNGEANASAVTSDGQEDARRLPHKEDKEYETMSARDDKVHGSGLLSGAERVYEGETVAFHREVLRAYVRSFDFRSQSLLDCLRMFLSAFRLPGEAQQIDRILQSFSEEVYEKCTDGSSLMATVDVAYLLSYSIIMLNTDLHNPNIREDKRMSLSDFIKNNQNYGQSVSQGRDLPREFLTEIYKSIAGQEIETKADSTGEAGEDALAQAQGSTGGVQQSAWGVTKERWKDLLLQLGSDEEAGKMRLCEDETELWRRARRTTARSVPSPVEMSAETSICSTSPIGAPRREKQSDCSKCGLACSSKAGTLGTGEAYDRDIFLYLHHLLRNGCLAAFVSPNRRPVLPLSVHGEEPLWSPREDSHVRAAHEAASDAGSERARQMGSAEDSTLEPAAENTKDKKCRGSWEMVSRNSHEDNSHGSSRHAVNNASAAVSASSPASPSTLATATNIVDHSTVISATSALPPGPTFTAYATKPSATLSSSPPTPYLVEPSLYLVRDVDAGQRLRDARRGLLLYLRMSVLFGRGATANHLAMCTAALSRLCQPIAVVQRGLQRTGREERKVGNESEGSVCQNRSSPQATERVFPPVSYSYSQSSSASPWLDLAHLSNFWNPVRSFHEFYDDLAAQICAALTMEFAIQFPDQICSSWLMVVSCLLKLRELGVLPESLIESELKFEAEPFLKGGKVPETSNAISTRPNPTIGANVEQLLGSLGNVEASLVGFPQSCPARDTSVRLNSRGNVSNGGRCDGELAHAHGSSTFGETEQRDNDGTEDRGRRGTRLRLDCGVESDTATGAWPRGTPQATHMHLLVKMAELQLSSREERLLFLYMAKKVTTPKREKRQKKRESLFDNVFRFFGMGGGTDSSLHTRDRNVDAEQGERGGSAVHSGSGGETHGTYDRHGSKNFVLFGSSDFVEEKEEEEARKEAEKRRESEGTAGDGPLNPAEEYFRGLTAGRDGSSLNARRKSSVKFFVAPPQQNPQTLATTRPVRSAFASTQDQLDGHHQNQQQQQQQHSTHLLQESMFRAWKGEGVDDKVSLSDLVEAVGAWWSQKVSLGKLKWLDGAQDMEQIALQEALDHPGGLAEYGFGAKCAMRGLTGLHYVFPELVRRASEPKSDGECVVEEEEDRCDNVNGFEQSCLEGTVTGTSRQGKVDTEREREVSSSGAPASPKAAHYILPRSPPRKVHPRRLSVDDGERAQAPTQALTRAQTQSQTQTRTQTKSSSGGDVQTQRSPSPPRPRSPGTASRPFLPESDAKTMGATKREQDWSKLQLQDWFSALHPESLVQMSSEMDPDALNILVHVLSAGVLWLVEGSELVTGANDDCIEKADETPLARGQCGGGDRADRDSVLSPSEAFPEQSASSSVFCAHLLSEIWFFNMRRSAFLWPLIQRHCEALLTVRIEQWIFQHSLAAALALEKTLAMLFRFVFYLVERMEVCHECGDLSAGVSGVGTGVGSEEGSSMHVRRGLGTDRHQNGSRDMKILEGDIGKVVCDLLCVVERMPRKTKQILLIPLLRGLEAIVIASEQALSSSSSSSSFSSSSSSSSSSSATASATTTSTTTTTSTSTPVSSSAPSSVSSVSSVSSSFSCLATVLNKLVDMIPGILECIFPASSFHKLLDHFGLSHRAYSGQNTHTHHPQGAGGSPTSSNDTESKVNVFPCLKMYVVRRCAAMVALLADNDSVVRHVDSVRLGRVVGLLLALLNSYPEDLQESDGRQSSPEKFPSKPAVSVDRSTTVELQEHRSGELTSHESPQKDKDCGIPKTNAVEGRQRSSGLPARGHNEGLRTRLHAVLLLLYKRCMAMTVLYEGNAPTKAAGGLERMNGVVVDNARGEMKNVPLQANKDAIVEKKDQSTHLEQILRIILVCLNTSTLEEGRTETLELLRATLLSTFLPTFAHTCCQGAVPIVSPSALASAVTAPSVSSGNTIRLLVSSFRSAIEVEARRLDQLFQRFGPQSHPQLKTKQSKRLNEGPTQRRSLSVSDFLQRSGRAESGAMNGVVNFDFVAIHEETFPSDLPAKLAETVSLQLLLLLDSLALMLCAILNGRGRLDPNYTNFGSKHDQLGDLPTNTGAKVQRQTEPADSTFTSEAELWDVCLRYLRFAVVVRTFHDTLCLFTGSTTDEACLGETMESNRQKRFINSIRFVLQTFALAKCERMPGLTDSLQKFQAALTNLLPSTVAPRRMSEVSVCIPWIQRLETPLETPKVANKSGENDTETEDPYQAPQIAKSDLKVVLVGPSGGLKTALVRQLVQRRVFFIEKTWEEFKIWAADCSSRAASSKKHKQPMNLSPTTDSQSDLKSTCDETAKDEGLTSLSPSLPAETLSGPARVSSASGNGAGRNEVVELQHEQVNKVKEELHLSGVLAAEWAPKTDEASNGVENHSVHSEGHGWVVVCFGLGGAVTTEQKVPHQRPNGSVSSSTLSPSATPETPKKRVQSAVEVLSEDDTKAQRTIAKLQEDDDCSDAVKVAGGQFWRGKFAMDVQGGDAADGSSKETGEDQDAKPDLNLSPKPATLSRSQSEPLHQRPGGSSSGSPTVLAANVTRASHGVAPEHFCYSSPSPQPSPSASGPRSDHLFATTALTAYNTGQLSSLCQRSSKISSLVLVSSMWAVLGPRSKGHTYSSRDWSDWEDARCTTEVAGPQKRAWAFAVIERAAWNALQHQSRAGNDSVDRETSKSETCKNTQASTGGNTGFGSSGRRLNDVEKERAHGVFGGEVEYESAPNVDEADSSQDNNRDSGCQSSSDGSVLNRTLGLSTSVGGCSGRLRFTVICPGLLLGLQPHKYLERFLSPQAQTRCWPQPSLLPLVHIDDAVQTLLAAIHKRANTPNKGHCHEVAESAQASSEGTDERTKNDPTVPSAAQVEHAQVTGERYLCCSAVLTSGQLCDLVRHSSGLPARPEQVRAKDSDLQAEVDCSSLEKGLGVRVRSMSQILEQILAQRQV